MRGLSRHEDVLLDYVRGDAAFAAVEHAIRNDVRIYSERRALRWTRCPALADDISQVLVLTLWQLLDAYDIGSEESVSAWCGARMEFAVRRMLRTTIARDATLEYELDESLEVAADEAHSLVELLADLRGIRDDGVRAYVLASLDAGGRDVVTRLASDAGLVARLGWSDVVRDSNAARRRAQRNTTLIEALGGAAW